MFSTLDVGDETSAIDTTFTTPAAAVVAVVAGGGGGGCVVIIIIVVAAVSVAGAATAVVVTAATVVIGAASGVAAVAASAVDAAPAAASMGAAAVAPGIMIRCNRGCWAVASSSKATSRPLGTFCIKSASSSQGSPLRPRERPPSRATVDRCREARGPPSPPCRNPPKTNTGLYCCCCCCCPFSAAIRSGVLSPSQRRRAPTGRYWRVKCRCCSRGRWVDEHGAL